MPTCPGPIQQGPRKGQTCGNETTTTFCVKHTRQAVVEKAAVDHIRYCDTARGCFTILEDHQSQCTHCLHKARIRDRKRDDQKRQDGTLCLDCGTKLTEVTRAKGKHDKSLRRCVPCYEKLQKYESKRAPRERNYKAEVFTNRHVIWNHYVKGAQKRRIDFSLSKALFNNLISKPCFYCEYQKEGEVNGIDRVDNNKGYTEENVVSCCATCNQLKGSQHPQEFLDKLRAIHCHIVLASPIPPEQVEPWATTYLSSTTPSFKAYAKSANSRNIAFTLLEDEFTALVKQSCYLCGLVASETNHNGIDRFDNTKGYQLENCRPCCGHCNLLKGTIEYDTLVEKAVQIARNYEVLTAYVQSKPIPVRASKTESRIKVECPMSQDSAPREYKPLNEIITPNKETPEEIRTLLENQTSSVEIKQWKSKQIFESIQEGYENDYKAFCEKHNSVPPQWEDSWTTFVSSVKGKPLPEAEPIVWAFIENLRRIRHNKLCTKDVLTREDRQQWPAATVVRFYAENKLEQFNAYMATKSAEAHVPSTTFDSSWDRFVTLLGLCEKDEGRLEIIKSFMASQRVQRNRYASQTA